MTTQQENKLIESFHELLPHEVIREYMLATYVSGAKNFERIMQEKFYASEETIKKIVELYKQWYVSDSQQPCIEYIKQCLAILNSAE